MTELSKIGEVRAALQSLSPILQENQSPTNPTIAALMQPTAELWYLAHLPAAAGHCARQLECQSEESLAAMAIGSHAGNSCQVFAANLSGQES